MSGPGASAANPAAAYTSIRNMTAPGTRHAPVFGGVLRVLLRQEFSPSISCGDNSETKPRLQLYRPAPQRRARHSKVRIGRDCSRLADRPNRRIDGRYVYVGRVEQVVNVRAYFEPGSFSQHAIPRHTEGLRETNVQSVISRSLQTVATNAHSRCGRGRGKRRTGYERRRQQESRSIPAEVWIGGLFEQLLVRARSETRYRRRGP